MTHVNVHMPALQLELRDKWFPEVKAADGVLLLGDGSVSVSIQVFW